MLTLGRTRIRLPAHAKALSNAAVGQPFNILFLGGDQFSCLVLEQLYAAKDVWQRLALVTQGDRRTGRRGKDISVSPLKVLGQTLDLEVNEIPVRKPEFKAWRPPKPFFPLSEEGSLAHHLLVTASFGRILTKRQLEIFLPGRRLNVHPSLLPAYRGPAPIQHALINDEQETGVCIVEMLTREAGIDAGDIWGQRLIPIPKNARFGEMRDILGRAGGEQLVKVLREMDSGKAQAVPQREEVETRAPMILFNDTLVDPMAMSADQIARRERAIARPLVIKLRQDRNIQLHETRVIGSDSVGAKPGVGQAIYDHRSCGLIIGCSDETYLHVTRVKQENRKLVAAREWWNGYRYSL